MAGKGWRKDSEGGRRKGGGPGRVELGGGIRQREKRGGRYIR